MKQLFTPLNKIADFLGQHCFNFVLLVSLFASIGFNAYAQVLSAREVYQVAKRGDVDTLHNLGRQIDVIDTDGVSAICLAVANRDNRTYNTLVSAGADVNRDCAGTPNTLRADSFHLTIPLLIAGGVLIGGIVAIGSSNHSDECGDSYISDPCPTDKYMVKCDADSSRHRCVDRTNTAHCTEYALASDTCTGCDTDYFLKGGYCNDRTNTAHCTEYALTSDQCTSCETGYLINGGYCNVCDRENDYVDDGNGNCIPNEAISTDTIIIQDKTPESTDQESIGIAAKTNEEAINRGTIKLLDNNRGVIGMFASENKTAVINRGKISGSGNTVQVVGMYTNGSDSWSSNDGTITFDKNSGTTLGMYGNESQTVNDSNGTITIDKNNGSGLVAGIYQTKGSANNKGTITLSNNTSTRAENATTIVGMQVINGSATNSGSITLEYNEGTGRYTGLEGSNATNQSGGQIVLRNNTASSSTGMTGNHQTKDNISNAGTIILEGNSGVSYGMRCHYGSVATNTKSGEIRIHGAQTAVGIFAESDPENSTNIAKVTNAGKIDITNSEHAFGIWATGPNVEIVNTGTIRIDGIIVNDTCSGSDCFDTNHAIVLNGATLKQDGMLETESLDLNSFGGNVVASASSQFVADDALSGDLLLSSDIVQNGFDTTYTVKDMIQAGNTNGLNLHSQSALFDATLENSSDAVMTMKSFNDVVDNASMADFLQANYAEGNNESLFATLKSATSIAQLNSNIDDLFGKKLLSRMAFEDLSMIREVNFDMNNRLFAQKGAFAFGGNVSPANYDHNIGSVGRYSLNGYNNGKMSFGVGVSITDVHTNDNHSANRRFDRNFMMSAPFGYKTHGFELITTPKAGYATGTYDRAGFNHLTYDGKVQKRMLALMNEARYPLKVGGIKIVPAAEFNVIGYNIKGHEDEKEYSLRIKSQNHYSVEAGFGLTAQKEFKPLRNHKFNLSGGVAIYHEFADPYDLNVAMNGMSGTYRLHDERRSDNRAAVRFGFGYTLKDYIEMTMNLLTNIDRTYRTDAGVDLKYLF